MSDTAGTPAAPDAQPIAAAVPEQPDGYTLWVVLRRDPAYPAEIEAGTKKLEKVIADAASDDVILRGFYDVSGLRADADLMFWIHGPNPEKLQSVARAIRRTKLLHNLLPTWSALGVHRAAEFNKAHIPGFLRGVEAKRWLTVYPFNRSYDWYLLPDEDRSRMLADHGRRGAAFKGVTANTVAAFALGDYEWLLPMEANELNELVDMMRDLRYTEARLHVREEIPFFTGRRIQFHEIAEVIA